MIARGRVKRFVAYVVAFGAVLPLGACSSSGDSSGATPGTSGCQAACARCGSDFCVDCAATAAKYNDAFEAPLYACVQEGGDASCGTLWESCAVRAELAAGRRPIDETYREACLAKKTECDAQGTSFADDDCLISMIFEESMVQAAQGCLSQPCPDAGSCLRPIFR
jgi:hypothetical protein